MEHKLAVRVERWGWYSMGVNVALIGINLVIARASGSLAVSAELLHNVVDLLTAMAVLVGIRLATRKSKSFPYGLYKLENVVAVGLAMMVFLTAYEIARDAVVAPPADVTVDAWMLPGIALAAAIPLVFSHFELSAGRQANSPALIADAREYRAHVYTTGVVLASLAGNLLGVRFDRLAAVVIVVAISKTGWDLLLDGVRVLLDASLDSETLQIVRETIEAEPAVSEVHGATGRNAGRYRFIEAEVSLRVDDLTKAEAASSRIEDAIREQVPFVERVLIHAEPARRTHLRYAIPVAGPDGQVSAHFGEAPRFAIYLVQRDTGAVVEQRLLSNPHLGEEKAKGIRVAEWLVKQKIDVLLLCEDLGRRGPAYVLSEAGIAVRASDCLTLGQIEDKLQAGALGRGEQVAV